jgi:predicted permease
MEEKKRTFKDLVNTPFKKAMFALQILSYFLIVGSPVIGGVIGNWLQLSTAKTGGVILGVFIAGEILFYGTLFFLGKEVVLLVKDHTKKWFQRKKKPSDH